MKKVYPLILLVIFIMTACINNHNKQTGIVIEMQSPELADTISVYITGSISVLGNWDPATVKMQSLGNHIWRFCLPDQVPELIEYKFTLGSWEKEAGGANGLPLQNFILKPKGDTLVKHEIYFWLDGKPRTFQGEITGNVKYHRQMHGEGILDRDLVVLLPNTYELNTNKHYPVLYMHDGQNLFDPATSSYGVDWQIDETLDSLSKTDQIEIPIVVGIYNTNERTADYTIGKQSEAYAQFVVDVVKPFIDKNYRTLPEAENTAVGGSSYGGLISFKMAWEYPNIFSKAFCLSPAFKVQNIDYVQNVLDYKGERKNLTFYIDNGGLGLEEQLQPGIEDMLKALEEKGYKKDKDFFWVSDKEARHFESDWAKRMPQAFVLMYSKKN
ncbi:MAG: hypothetical protein J7J72_09370 [Bacteroidales bacterium]|nr:hypothetical protein [Bacteroidales bacterium]